MLKNFLVIALGNLRRQPLYSTVNILGLAVGMACSLIILLWVQDELSYDDFHSKAERIYRVVPSLQSFGNKKSALTPSAIGVALNDNYKQIENFTRISFKKVLVLRNQNIKSKEQKGIFADSTFLNVFSFPLLLGDSTALDLPYSIVLSKKVAQKYFGNYSPIGKKLVCNNRFELTVTGVFKDLPTTSHLQFEFVIPLRLLELEFSIPIENEWDNYRYYTYILARENYTSQSLDSICNFYKLVDDKEKKLELQSLKKIHLNSDNFIDIAENNNVSIAYVFFFGGVALIILLVVSFNFMNLNMAKSVKRFREIGVRKSVGSSVGHLMVQFYIESFLYCSIALFFALVFVEWISPMFNELTNKNLDIHNIYNFKLWIFSILILLLSTFISGTYPALYLSSRPTIQILKDSFRIVRTKIQFRRLIIIFHFTIAAVLIISTLSIRQQMDYIRNKELGYNNENLWCIQTEGKAKQKIHFFKEKLLQNSAITFVSETSSMPFYQTISTEWAIPNSKKSLQIHLTSVDKDFFSTLQIPFVEGGKIIKPSEKEYFILNQTAALKMKLKPPIVGQLLVFERDTCIIGGIVRDYYFRHLGEVLAPMILKVSDKNMNFLFVRVQKGQEEVAQKHIEKIWNEFSPDFPLSIDNQRDKFNEVYRKEVKISEAFYYFSLLSIFISCLGLFGIVSFVSEQRTKEIGVRKVLGASTFELLRLQSMDYIKWSIVACLLACPIAYAVILWWLGYFAYHIPIQWSGFLFGSSFIVGITILTLLYRSTKTATRNPVESLRYE